MTKTLTEQWRDGRLEDGFYYILIDFFGKKEIRTEELFSGEFCTTPQEFVKEILDVVPPYVKFREIIRNSDELVQKIHILNEQNTKQYNELCEEIKKNNILEKKLEITTKALKGVCVWANTGNGGEKAVKKVCEKALKEMEGVK